jgi:hypothetical protein
MGLLLFEVIMPRGINRKPWAERSLASRLATMDRMIAQVPQDEAITLMTSSIKNSPHDAGAIVMALWDKFCKLN